MLVLSSLSTYFVSDIHGKLILGGVLSGNQVDISELQTGIYFLKLMAGLRTVTKKIVVGN